MKIGISISELLYRHEEVILPGLGRFFTKYVPAKFIPEEGKVLAPSKTIAFDPSRKEGDTPLVEFLAMKHGIEASQVSGYLEHFVGELGHLLESGKKVELEQVGVFSKDASGALVFGPDKSVNYLNLPTGEVPEPPLAEPPSDVFTIPSPALPAEPAIAEGGVPEPEKAEPPAAGKPGESDSPVSREEPRWSEPEKIEPPAADAPEEASISATGEEPWWNLPEKSEPAASDKTEESDSPVSDEKPWSTKPEKSEPAASDKTEESGSPVSDEKPWWNLPEKSEPAASDKTEEDGLPETVEEPWWKLPEEEGTTSIPSQTVRIESEEAPTPVVAPHSGQPEPERAAGTVRREGPPANIPTAGKESTIVEKERKPELPKALKWLAFTIVPLLIILIILALNFNYVVGLFKRERAQPAPAAIEQRDPVAVEEADPVAPAEADVAATAPATPAPAATAVQPPAPVPGQTIYFIVVGSFPDEDSAERLAQSLRDRGAPLASVFMRTPNNYHRVCYGYYNSLDEAERVLATVKADINPEAWILHR